MRYTWKPHPRGRPPLVGTPREKRSHAPTFTTKVLVSHGQPSCRQDASSRSLLYPGRDDAVLFQGSAQRRLLICPLFLAAPAPGPSKGVRLAPAPFQFTSRAQYAVVFRLCGRGLGRGEGRKEGREEESGGRGKDARFRNCHISNTYGCNPKNVTPARRLVSRLISWENQGILCISLCVKRNNRLMICCMSSFALSSPPFLSSSAHAIVEVACTADNG